jgi:hypothetical protein
MVTLPVEAGAVKSPVAVMVPALADQVMADAPPLAAVAVHCEVVLGAMMAGAQETERPLLVAGALVAELPPHAAINAASRHAKETAKALRRKIDLNRDNII